MKRKNEQMRKLCQRNQFVKQCFDSIRSFFFFEKGNERASIKNIRQFEASRPDINCRYWFSSSSLSWRRISRKLSTVMEVSLHKAHIFSNAVSRLLAVLFMGNHIISKRAVVPAGICGGTSRVMRRSAGISTVCVMVI